MEPVAIVLFDGICNLCNRAVQFIIKHDPGGYFSFASLQSGYAKERLAENGITGDIHSLVLIENGRSYHKSTAVLRIFHHLSGIWRILGFLLVIPRFIRDGVYDWIARHRYQWFGKKTTCMIPDPPVQDRFLEW